MIDCFVACLRNDLSMNIRSELPQLLKFFHRKSLSKPTSTRQSETPAAFGNRLVDNEFTWSTVQKQTLMGRMFSSEPWVAAAHFPSAFRSKSSARIAYIISFRSDKETRTILIICFSTLDVTVLCTFFLCTLLISAMFAGNFFCYQVH